MRNAENVDGPSFVRDAEAIGLRGDKLNHGDKLNRGVSEPSVGR